MVKRDPVQVHLPLQAKINHRTLRRIRRGNGPPGGGHKGFHPVPGLLAKRTAVQIHFADGSSGIGQDRQARRLFVDLRIQFHHRITTPRFHTPLG